MHKIHVTKTFLPPYDEYCAHIKKIWDSTQLTNQGPLLVQFESLLKDFLGVEHIHFLTNGTLALQLALAALNINDGEIITTPFSYVASTSAILWQRCTPVFVDIEPDNFTIDANKIEAAISPRTRAILAVHVFGYACHVEKIQNIAHKYNLKVIYDGAHAFASKYHGKSLYHHGDISTLSFHATKLFHTIEGGACIVKDATISHMLNLQKRFGHTSDEHVCLGINAKATEFQAAMGLSNFPYIEKIIQERKEICELYDRHLQGVLERPRAQAGLEYNYAYYPVLFASEEELLYVFQELEKNNVFLRRYFYPSLNLLPYANGNACPLSENVSTRIACLPLSPQLPHTDVKLITTCIKKALQCKKHS